MKSQPKILDVTKEKKFATCNERESGPKRPPPTHGRVKEIHPCKQLVINPKSKLWS